MYNLPLHYRGDSISLQFLTLKICKQTNRPISRIEWGVQNPPKVDLLDPKSGLFEPHPFNPPTKTPFWSTLWPKVDPFARFGGCITQKTWDLLGCHLKRPLKQQNKLLKSFYFSCRSFLLTQHLLWSYTGLCILGMYKCHTIIAKLVCELHRNSCVPEDIDIKGSQLGVFSIFHTQYLKIQIPLS